MNAPNVMQLSVGVYFPVLDKACGTAAQFTPMVQGSLPTAYKYECRCNAFSICYNKLSTISLSNLTHTCKSRASVYAWILSLNSVENE